MSRLIWIYVVCKILFFFKFGVAMPLDTPAIRKVKEQDAEYGVPMTIYWTTDQVADWIEELGFPNYRVGINKISFYPDIMPTHTKSESEPFAGDTSTVVHQNQLMVSHIWVTV